MRPSFSGSVFSAALPLIGTILLAGCATQPVTQTAVAQAAYAANDPEALPPAATKAASCGAGPVGEIPLRLTRQQAFVPLHVNNATLNMLLDTGDFVTALTPDAVERLALPESSRPRLTMTGIGGAYQAPIVEAADVQYLDHHLNRLPFAVLPDSEFRPDEGTDGLFGANFLSAYNVELDFPGHRLRFYESAAGCGGTPEWVHGATPLPATDAGHQLLLIPVQVNGVTLNALIDTGSEDTSITQQAAAAAGVTEGAMRGDEQITEQGLGESGERMHRFASITIGGTTFHNPVLAVDDAPSPLQNAVTVAANSALPEGHQTIDVILGANFLFKTRLFLAYKHGAVFIQ